MKTLYRVLLSVLCVMVLLVSCSRKKDKFMSRNFHAVTAEFNALYNGYNALEIGRNTLNESYFDNYWDILPIERMQVTDRVVLSSQAKNENFARAEEKAVKAIQKHSINIQGREKNPQMDEAYLLLGKARYFDQRFIPALEALNYILYKYPASDKINQARIWREKTNIRLGNDDIAIVNLKRLLELGDLNGQDLADATSMLAQAYINTKSVDSAVTQLEIASKATKSNDERGRYRFIQGQLYNILGHKDSANLAFDQVIKLNRKTPRIYMISAHIEKAKNFDYEKGNKYELLELLTSLEKNRENRPYLDKIYHQKGAYYQETESDSLAKRFYNKSLRTNSRDKILKAKNYEIIGDMSFDKYMYRAAGQYYDSTMLNLTVKTRPYRAIKRKRDNLEDVIRYEGIAHEKDSILRLVYLPEDERISYFESYIEILKEKAKEAEKAQKEAERKKNLAAAANNNTQLGPQGGTPRGGGTPGQAAAFYFYNPTTVAYGKTEFIKTWGDRALEDNWRWSTKGSTNVADNNTVSTDTTALKPVSNEELFDPQFYIAKIPTDKKVIDSISKERNFAYYQLGLIYKEKFKEFGLAKDKFLNLLQSNPEERLILPSKYNLYKIYKELGEEGEADIAKNEIISKYPDSRYAIILSNPDLITLGEDSPECLYEALYIEHENQEFENVISKSDDYIALFDGEDIVPKFELLKATAIGRLHGYEAYSDAINFVALNYASSDEGKEAQEIQNKILPVLMNKTFEKDDPDKRGHYKVIFKFKRSDPKAILDFKTTLDEELEAFRYYSLKTSMDVYNPETMFVVVHGIKNYHVAKEFIQLVTKAGKTKIKEPYFSVVSTNYKIIQVHKNLDDYLNVVSN